MLFWWVVYPTACLVVMVAGTVYRYVTRPLSWSARSSEIFEKRWLSVGSPLFHWGILLVLLGHAVGLLVPMAWFSAVGITPEVYHRAADVLGGLAGLAAWIGLAILLIRRLGHPVVRRHSSLSDLLILGLLFLVVTTGELVTIGYNNLVGPFEYRATVGPWLRGLLVGHPDPALMAHVPWLYQVHIALAFLLLGVSPFSRLVHLWSAPIAYLRRMPIQYRARDGYHTTRTR